MNGVNYLLGISIFRLKIVYVLIYILENSPVLSNVTVCT